MRKSKPAVGGRNAPHANKKQAKTFVRPFATDVQFPRPGGQDCFHNDEPGGDTNFTAVIFVPDGTTVERVRVVVGTTPYGSDTPLVPVPHTDPVKYVVPFSGLSKASGNLIPNTPCAILVETSDQNNRGVRFTHVPPAPELELTSVTTIAQHYLVIEGTATNINLDTIAILAGSARGTNIHHARATGPFSGQVQAQSAMQDVTITADSSDGQESVSFDFRLKADFDAPVFDPDPPHEAENDTMVTITGDVTDAGSGFESDSELHFTVDPDITAILGAIDSYDPGYSAADKKFSFTLKIETAVLEDAQYNVTFHVKDVAGNLPAVSQPVSFFTPLP